MGYIFLRQFSHSASEPVMSSDSLSARSVQTVPAWDSRKVNDEEREHSIEFYGNLTNAVSTVRAAPWSGTENADRRTRLLFRFEPFPQRE